MSELWKNIMREYIGSYEAIKLLNANGLMDEEETLIYKSNLLKSIIEDFQSEVEDA